MTLAIAAALCVACVADWVARATASERLELVSKPLATGLVIALVLARGGDDPGARALLIGALLCCLAGDVLLLPKVDRFVAGLSAFLAAHLLFFAAAAARGLVAPAPALGVAAAIALCLPLVGRRILAGARQRDPRLALPVLVYILVVAALPVVAAATGRALALAGALSFVVSDALLGVDRFVRPLGAASAAVMVSYHLALVGLALGLG